MTVSAATASSLVIVIDLHVFWPRVRQRGRSVALTEDVLKEKSEPGRWFLCREDVPYQCEDIGNGVQGRRFAHAASIS
jgi:hypothetical protein